MNPQGDVREPIWIKMRINYWLKKKNSSPWSFDSVSGYILLGLNFVSIIWRLKGGYQSWRRCWEIKTLVCFYGVLTLWGNLDLTQRLQVMRLAEVDRCVSLSLSLANSCSHVPLTLRSPCVPWTNKNTTWFLLLYMITVSISCPCINKDQWRENLVPLNGWLLFSFWYQGTTVHCQKAI